jgi:hypothetical protein
MRIVYLNKIRTYRFLIILLLTIIAGYVFVPASDALYATLGWGSDTVFYRGVYNSAWIGAMVAMLSGVFLSLLGFYIVKDTIKEDERTGVGQIVPTTPLKNSFYTVGNALGNFAVLSTMIGVIILTTIGMQFVRGEDTAFDLMALIAPFVVFVLPLMFLVAAIAILFDSRQWLSGSLGNIIYIFIWLIGLPLSSDIFDMYGVSSITSSMRSAGLVTYPDLTQNRFILGFSWGYTEARSLETFIWDGLQWNLGILQNVLILFCLGVVIALLASVSFKRFDPASESSGSTTAMHSPLIDLKAVEKIRITPPKDIELEPLAPGAVQFRFSPILVAEWQLALKEFLGIGTYGVIAAFILLGLVLPLSFAQGIILPIAWFIPIIMWSKMGARESTHGTSQFLFTSAKYLRHKFLASWLVGVLLSVSIGSGVALNLGINGSYIGVLAWFVGALFIPSLALCCGVWTGTNKLFEFGYTMLWYIGPMNKMESLDYMGSLPGTAEAGIWIFYLALTILLLGLSFIGRRWQMQRD